MGPFGPELLSTRAQVFSRLVRSAAVAKKEWSSAAISSKRADVDLRSIVDNEGYSSNLSNMDLYSFFFAFLEEMGCMVDSLPLIVPVACLVDGPFLMTQLGIDRTS